MTVRARLSDRARAELRRLLGDKADEGGKDLERDAQRAMLCAESPRDERKIARRLGRYDAALTALTARLQRERPPIPELLEDAERHLDLARAEVRRHLAFWRPPTHKTGPRPDGRLAAMREAVRYWLVVLDLPDALRAPILRLLYEDLTGKRFSQRAQQRRRARPRLSS